MLPSKMFFKSKRKKTTAFRGPIKYFKPAHPELGWSGDGKWTIF